MGAIVLSIDTIPLSGRFFVITLLLLRVESFVLDGVLW